MRHFYTVSGAVIGNFVAWSLISYLPVPPIITFALVILTGVLMIWAIIYFGKAPAKDPLTPNQS
jgi:hypothetical protein